MNRPTDTAFGRLQARVQIDTPLGVFLGEQRIALLEAIGRQGSIARAAKVVGLSYKAAWEAVDDMNNLSTEALVLRVVGGPRGGGTTLTAHALRLIAFYRALQAEHQATLQRLQQVLAEPTPAGLADDASAYRRLLHRFALQTSARNQFVGTVQRVLADEVEARVWLDLGSGLTLEALVTTESAERLKLRHGQEVHALVKSGAVGLWAPEAERSEGLNHYPGEITRCAWGQSKADITVALAGHHLQAASVLSVACARDLGLAPGGQIVVGFRPADVLLAVAA